MTLLKRCALLFTIGLIGCLQCCAVFATDVVRIGTLAWQGSEEAEIHWSSMVRNLEERLGGKRIELRHFDLGAMAAALEEGELDFVVTNPGHYVSLEAQSGITRIATQVSDETSNPEHVVGSAVVVLDRRQDIQRLEDLRGKTLAAVSPDAFGGYQLIRAELRRLGLDPENGRVTPVFTDFPMTKVIDAVVDGKTDAGILRACLLEHMEQEGSVAAGRLRVLSPRPEIGNCAVTSQLYPGWAFAAASRTPPALSREVLLALLSLPPDTNQQWWSVPADYHPVHELLRELQTGPYAFLRETSLEAQLRRYWAWVLGLVLLMLAGAAYTLHVEHLVQRRTRELTQALDERHHLESRVQAGQQQMDHLSRLSILGELSGRLAHELNQPLAAIGNYARSLLRRQDSGTLSEAALRQAAEEIANESERAAGILGSIRSFARKRSRRQEICDIADLVHEAGSFIGGMLSKARPIELRHNLSLAERQVLVDPLQIQQVLLNLFKNAWDAQQSMDDEHPIEVSLEREDDRCAVEVRDHGPGLTPELQAHFLEAFFTTKPDGLGLGLPICKTIVEAHGGELIARNANPGLVFRFSLPLAHSTDTDTVNTP
uniref:histidine kinase n=1 Tax=Dechloromonas aromatica (strain RCB) TaxID=159087 RepID=Q47D57_DECAR